jgi:hypothetical protein
MRIRNSRSIYIFHQKASRRKSKNAITRIARQDGTFTEDVEDLNSMTAIFYQNLYYSEGTIGIEEVLSHVPCKVTPQLNAILIAPYTSF